MEVEIAGSRSELSEIASWIRNQRSPIAIVNSEQNPAPYTNNVAVIVIQESASEKVVMRVDHDAASLHVSGSSKLLHCLADEIRELATDAEPGYHLHLEYFDGHFFLGPGSVPVVVQLDAEGP
jgi:hypothetical protein